MKRFLPLFITLMLSPASADVMADQLKACTVKLTPASRAAIITVCGTLLKTAKLPPLVAGQAFAARGNAYALGADFARAISDFSAAIDSDPLSAAPLAARGVALMKQKKIQDAASDFDAALKLDGHNALALYGRGLSARKLGQDGGADMAAAIALDPPIADFYADNGLGP